MRSMQTTNTSIAHVVNILHAAYTQQQSIVDVLA